MQLSFQDLKQLAARHLRSDVVKILEQNQLVLWDSNGVFVVKTPDMNLTAYAFKTVGEGMQKHAATYVAVLSRKILGRADEKQALQNFSAYLTGRRRGFRALAKLAKTHFRTIQHKTGYLQFWIKEDRRIFCRVSSHTLRGKSSIFARQSHTQC